MIKLKKDLIIAIDGHASCGKSTLAKRLAKALGYTYIDTGAMYRAVTLFAIENGLIKDGKVDNKKLIEALPSIKISFAYNPKTGKSETILNGKNVENEIRKMKVSQYASPVATIPEVRKQLVSLQQEMGKQKRITMDGRDIGTVVFPEAEIKIFLTASAEVRAKRRYDEYIEKGIKADYQEILQNVITRDKIDSTRKASPLKQADDAILIDNSNLNIEETYVVAMAIIVERFGNGCKFE